RVSADNKYCPAGNSGIVEHSRSGICGFQYNNCNQWCLDRGKWFSKKYIKKGTPVRDLVHGVNSRDICVCCCRDPIPGQDPPPSPPRGKYSVYISHGWLDS
ncbi:hypothetical protein MKX03_000746, partial [Papaver bracteatum]